MKKKELALALLLASWASRLVTFVLDEEVYPNVNLARGIPYVISTMLRYAILCIGIVIGLVGFLFLLAKISLYGAELNPVLSRHLWPRSLVRSDPTAAFQALEHVRSYLNHVGLPARALL